MMFISSPTAHNWAPTSQEGFRGGDVGTVSMTSAYTIRDIELQR